LIEGDKEPTVRAIVLTGSGQQHFCAGMDLKEVVDEGNKQYPHPMKDVHRNLHEVLLEVGKPTIAAINGAAVGGGSELSLACDLRIAVEDSYFSQPVVKVGMGVNVSSVILLLLISHAIAL